MATLLHRQLGATPLVIFGLTLLSSCDRGQSRNQVTATDEQGRATNASASSTKSSSATATDKKKLALLIGINRYKHSNAVSPLEGAVNDVGAMKRVLTSSRYGFHPSNVHVLINEQATRDNILKREIEGFLIKNANAGAIILFHYSGHGSRMANPKDPSGYDNTIVPYDSRDPGKQVSDILDKELNIRLRQLSDKVGATGGVTFILDSCHSGTGAKAAGQPRRAPDDTRFGNNPPTPDLAGGQAGTRDITGSGYSDEGINYVLLAGSRTDQLSYERQQGFGIHGALTFYLIRELEKPSSLKRTYRDIMNPVIQAVSSEFPNQIPQLEGKNANKVVFGDETIQTQNYVLANPAANNRVELQGGRTHGFTVQSEFDVYADSAQKLAPPDQPVARIKLVQVDSFKSEGTIIKGQRVPSAAKAIERVHNFEAQRTRVLYDNLVRSPALQRIKTVLDRHPRKPFETVTDGAFQIRMEEKDGHVHTFGPDGVELSSGVPTSDENLTERMERRMLAWARWFGLRTLSNPVAALRVEFTLTPKGEANPLAPGRIPSFEPGTKRFDLKVRNLTDKKLFIYILDLTSAGRVTQEYPDVGSHVPIEPTKEAVIPDWNVGLPAGARFVRDVHKLIATTKQVDLQFLQMETPRGVERARAPAPPDDPLNRLLFDSAFGSRDSGRTVAEEWTTTEVIFDVCQEIGTNKRCK